MKKPVPLEKAISTIPEGATVMVGGFMGVGSPQRLIDELVQQRCGGSQIGGSTIKEGVGK